MERLGRAAMDFGLEGFLDKFEEHFGKLLTKALVLIIALAVVAVSVGLIWHYLISPVLEFFEASERTLQYSNLVQAGLVIGLGVLFAMLIYSSRLTRKIRKMNADMRKSVGEIEAITARLNKAMEDVRAVAPERK